MSSSTLELVKSVFGDALEKYTSGLLTAVCSDYELDFQELSQKYMDGNFLQKSRDPKHPRAPKVHGGIPKYAIMVPGDPSVLMSTN